MPTVRMPPVSPKDPVKPAGWSGPGSCQIVAFTLGPVGCMILRAPFRREVSISPSLEGLLQSSPAGLQSQILWGLFFLCWTPSCRGWHGAQSPRSSCGRTSDIISLQCVGHPPGGEGFDYVANLFLLTVSVWFLLYVFSCRFFFFFW